MSQYNGLNLLCFSLFLVIAMKSIKNIQKHIHKFTCNNAINGQFLHMGRFFVGIMNSTHKCIFNTICLYYCPFYHYFAAIFVWTEVNFCCFRTEPFAKNTNCWSNYILMFCFCLLNNCVRSGKMCAFGLTVNRSLWLLSTVWNLHRKCVESCILNCNRLQYAR